MREFIYGVTDKGYVIRKRGEVDKRTLREGVKPPAWVKCSETITWCLEIRKMQLISEKKVLFYPGRCIL